jgi:ATP/ADP translocase/HEAT repeat protein
MGAAAQQIKSFITNLLRVQPGEGRKTGLMFGVMMCVVGTFIIGRIARDSLFLSRYSVDYLPFLYIWVAIGVSIQSYLYSRVADRFRRDRVFKASLGLLAGLYLAARLAMYWVGDWFYPVLYVLVELVGSLTLIQAWTLANEVFNTREAKRLFGLVGAGGVISSVVAGFAIRAVVKWIGTENLLYLCTGTLLIGVLLVDRVSHACREELLTSLAGVRREIRTRIAFLGDFKRIFKNKHLIFVAGLVSVLVFVMTYVDYQFKVTARYAFLNREDQLAGFFGLFYGLTGAFNVLVQGFATGRILERFGVLFSLLLLPLSLLGGSICWLALPALWSASLLKASDATLRYTVNDATVQLLYLPVPSHTRGRAKAFVDGIIRPISIGLAGMSLAWLMPLLSPRAFGGVLVLLLGIWIGLTFFVRREYLTSLVNTLRSRRFNFDADSTLVPDQAASQALRKALEDRDEHNVLHALEMIPHTSRTDWGEPLVQLIRHRSARVRAKAIALLGDMAQLQHGPVVYACLRDPNPEVLSAAIDSYCAIGKERAVRTISLFLEHEDAQVRSAAVVGLIRYGGLDGVLSSAERLKKLLESERAEERAAGARILGKIKVRNFYHPLLELMTDENLEVRQAAIWASGRMKSPELLPALVYRIESQETRTAASEALVAIGTPAVRLLRKVLCNPDETPATREAVPTILARIGDQACLDSLQECLEVPESRLRSKVLDAVHRLRLRKPHLTVDEQRVRKALMGEMRTLYEQAILTIDLNQAPGSLLADACAARRAQTIERSFRLLGCLLPVRPVDAVFANLSSAQRHSRANALEVIDNLLDKDLKRLLMPVLDPNLQQDLIEIGREAFGLQQRSRDEWLAEMIDGPDPWLATCALHEAGKSTTPDLATLALTQTAADDSVLRETALTVLAKIQPAEEFRKTAQRHLRDPSLQVRAMAAWLADQFQPA